MSIVTVDGLFFSANSLAMATWLALAVSPLRWRFPGRIAIGVAALIAMLYAALLGAFWFQAEGGFSSLAGVARLFEHRGILLAGWVHYLAFDLLVGTWERSEAARLGLSRWTLLPCLALTFLFGPLGWLAFLTVRWLRERVLAAA